MGMTLMKKRNKRTPLIFAATLAIILVVLATSAIKTNAYNNQAHLETFSGAGLFSPDEARKEDVSVTAVPRSDTCTKVFNLNQDSSERSFQAYTYDFIVANNTQDEVASFSFKLSFTQNTFLASAWNGALEIHQNTGAGEIVDVIPDLREFDPHDYAIETFTSNGESFVFMQAGDYLVYLPSSSVNAMEVPIRPAEATTPGMIVYVPVGETLEGSSLELQYTFHRYLTGEPLFWIALVGTVVWLVAAIIFSITSSQIKKYQERHERDNEIINESIETFTGFIDAKDPYTHGHSKRVAIYTRLIAKEMGFSGEELDRIYYIALLHDCGKIGVSDSILRKPGKLTDEEYEIIKSHTVRGGEILSTFKSLKDADLGAFYHHERYDGKGYPEGKARDEIPLIARMICVADSFDAMNTNRVYRNRLSKERILYEIESNMGRQFDPTIAKVMLDLIHDGKIPMNPDEANP